MDEMKWQQGRGRSSQGFVNCRRPAACRTVDNYNVMVAARAESADFTLRRQAEAVVTSATAATCGHEGCASWIDGDAVRTIAVMVM
jgi:hypothetical protein